MPYTARTSSPPSPGIEQPMPKARRRWRNGSASEPGVSGHDWHPHGPSLAGRPERAGSAMRAIGRESCDFGCLPLD